jgi:hypothetical protein
LVPSDDDLMLTRGAGVKPRAVSRHPAIQLDLFQPEGETP